MIISAKYFNSEKSVVIITYDTGLIINVPVDMNNFHCQELNRWVKNGGEIEDFESYLIHRQKHAKFTRNEAEDSNIVVLGVEWQVDEKSRDRMNRVIATAARDNAPNTETVTWILADDSERETTVGDLCLVLDAHAYRTQAIFSQYRAWLAGDMSSYFEYVEPE